jgi:hypothetical protein
MKLIFECETELGRCDLDKINGHFGDETGEWMAFALTTAAVTGRKRMLRIEQRCYLRSTVQFDNIRSQNWVRPEITLEPTAGPKEEILKAVQQLHEQFVRKARTGLTEQSVLAISDPIDAQQRARNWRINHLPPCAHPRLTRESCLGGTKR